MSRVSAALPEAMRGDPQHGATRLVRKRPWLWDLVELPGGGVRGRGAKPGTLLRVSPAPWRPSAETPRAGAALPSPAPLAAKRGLCTAFEPPRAEGGAARGGAGRRGRCAQEAGCFWEVAARGGKRASVLATTDSSGKPEAQRARPHRRPGRPESPGHTFKKAQETRTCSRGGDGSAPGYGLRPCTWRFGFVSLLLVPPRAGKPGH